MLLRFIGFVVVFEVFVFFAFVFYAFFIVAGETLAVADTGEAHGRGDAGVGEMGWSGAVAVAVAVAVDALEAGGGDGGDVTAFEDAGGPTHAVALGDSARAGRRCTCWSRLRAIGSHGEREYVCATTHVGFAEGPVHGFACAPGHAELDCNGVPEFGLESGRDISWLVHMVAGRAGFVFPVVESGKEIRVIPIVDSGELVALLLAPICPLLEVVLVVQSAADGATAWYLETDVVPFHATATEYDDFGVFGRCPLASGLTSGV